jgi:hypothetical protein
MSARLIAKDKDYPRLSKANSGYVENPYFERSDLCRGYFCNDCVYFINGNDCAIVKKDGPDVNGKESGIIAPDGICTLWMPDESKTY